MLRTLLLYSTNNLFCCLKEMFKAQKYSILSFIKTIYKRLKTKIFKQLKTVFKNYIFLEKQISFCENYSI